MSFHSSFQQPGKWRWNGLWSKWALAQYCRSLPASLHCVQLTDTVSALFHTIGTVIGNCYCTSLINKPSQSRPLRGSSNETRCLISTFRGRSVVCMPWWMCLGRAVGEFCFHHMAHLINEVLLCYKCDLNFNLLSTPHSPSPTSWGILYPFSAFCCRRQECSPSKSPPLTFSPLCINGSLAACSLGSPKAPNAYSSLVRSTKEFVQPPCSELVESRLPWHVHMQNLGHHLGPS